MLHLVLGSRIGPHGGLQAAVGIIDVAQRTVQSVDAIPDGGIIGRIIIEFGPVARQLAVIRGTPHLGIALEQRPERLCSVMEACRQGNLEPKRLRLVQQRVEKAPKLFLLEARKGARPGGLVVEPTLIIEDGQGGYSQEMREIYGDYARKEETR